MSQDVIEALPRSMRKSISHLLGLHVHVFSPWAACWATQSEEDTMTLLQTRRCEHCERVEFKRDVTAMPASGFPYELHMKPGVRSRD